MIEGLAAIVLNILAIAFIVFIVSNMAVSAVVTLLAQRFIGLEVASRKAVLWLLVLLPWIAVLCVIACFIYRLAQLDFSGELSSYAHWHHITSFNLLSWHGFSLYIALLACLYIFSKQLARLLSHRRELALLTSLAQQSPDDIYIIDEAQPCAFTSGFLHRKCYITSGMINHISAQEQQVIIAHEQAHAELHDPLKKWLFSVCSAFFLPAIALRLKLQMTLAMEQAADNAVLKQGIEATFVASTLVKVARLNQKVERHVFTRSDLVANFGADVLEQRVYFLLGQLKLKPINRLLTLVFIALTFSMSLLSIDGVHHLIETVFSH